MNYNLLIINEIEVQKSNYQKKKCKSRVAKKLNLYIYIVEKDEGDEGRKNCQHAPTTKI